MHRSGRALLGAGWRTGAELAALSMLGDLLSSFLKRRLRRRPRSSFGLDQIPEALVPVLVLQTRLGLTAWDIAVLVGAFIILEIGFPDCCSGSSSATGRIEARPKPTAPTRGRSPLLPLSRLGCSRIPGFENSN